MALATWAIMEHSVGWGQGWGVTWSSPWKLALLASSTGSSTESTEGSMWGLSTAHPVVIATLIPLQGQACTSAFVFCGLGLLPKLGMESHALAMLTSQPLFLFTG